jgi:hypothetical protein
VGAEEPNGRQNAIVGRDAYFAGRGIAVGSGNVQVNLLDLRALPNTLPEGLVYRGRNSAEMVGLIDALRSKLPSN